MTGGPNPAFAPDPAYAGPPLVPPRNQPAMKSYRDWNTGWPQNSWEVTEPAIGYQGRYVRLLAAFAVAPAPQLAVELGEIASGAATAITVGGADPGDQRVPAGQHDHRSGFVPGQQLGQRGPQLGRPRRPGLARHRGQQVEVPPPAEHGGRRPDQGLLRRSEKVEAARTQAHHVNHGSTLVRRARVG